jgi:hypothetical protein
MTAQEVEKREAVACLIAAVRAEPDDHTRRCALEDAAQEGGCTPTAARRLACRVTREARAARDLERARSILERSSAARSAVRNAAGLRPGAHPCEVAPGTDAPRVEGEEGYHTFKNGGHCQFPGAAKRAGYRIEYHRSTLRYIVGAGWVLKRFGK